MRWFNDAAGESGDHDRALDEYLVHLAWIAPKLPATVAALASDPRFALHDGRFHEVVVDPDNHHVTIAIDCGDLNVGYRRVTLVFDGAAIVPDDLHLLGEAVGAQFRANHWHADPAVTEVLDQEIDLLPDGRFVLRLRLWPFHEFAIEFSSLTLAEVPLAERAPMQPGLFVLKTNT